MRNPRLVDAHTHFFSRPFFDALARASPLPGNPGERLARVGREAGLELPDPDVDAHLARWLAELDRHDVAHAVTFASLPEEADAVAEAVAAAGGRLTAYALVNPAADGAVAETRRHFEERGMRGILLFPAMHHVGPGDPRAQAVLEVVAAHEAVAVVHCGMLQVRLRDRFGLPRPYDLRHADPLDLVPAANAFRAATFVVPHFGAGLFRETLMVGAQCENVLVDTSSSNAWMATQPPEIKLADVLARALDVFGPERVLFGTDSSTFPRGWRDDVHAAQAAALDGLGVDAATRGLIFGENAARLLGLPEDPHRV